MFKRVLLKLSGEALGDAKGNGPIDINKLNALAKEIKEIYDQKVQLAIVVGAGNIWRGKMGEQMGMERSAADYMGMLATILNALAIQNALESIGVETRVQTSLTISQVAEPYIRRKALSHLTKNRVLILGGGTGNPYFSTDTTAALRAIELEVDAILMAKNGVDGVYSSDPKTDPHAQKYDQISYMEIMSKKLKVMDLTAISLCMDNKMKLFVFNMNQNGNIIKAVKGDTSIGTLIQ
ncbi:MAG TPA: UMP kinase [Candidatus Caccosoma faecigallinarum]|uniref:Uridylate kinase n=1 Tax=Candidatus Caccosoma faecigallinarum TaxID=2840720 RepID=A0A9D1G9P9_9FIRM|nr:uridylate kinase [Firmicutes bacterium CAG:631]HIT17328.1 UMP kinase [Candidatus Caccosoma faecigallinarum]